MPLTNENHHIPRHPGIRENNVSRNHNPWDQRYFQREQAFDNQDYYSTRPDAVSHYNASNTYQQTTFQDRRAFDQSYRPRQDNEDHYYYQGCHDYSSSSHSP
uniref:Uncharacterized protein n=1 Tax=Proboscia inermis TaxID=420281 RepID=A0A7S0CJE6_9STRA